MQDLAAEWRDNMVQAAAEATKSDEQVLEGEELTIEEIKLLCVSVLSPANRSGCLRFFLQEQGVPLVSTPLSTSACATDILLSRVRPG